MSRQLLCDAVGSAKHARSAATLVAVLDDENVAGHAVGTLRKFDALSAEEIEKVKPFLLHRHGWIRREAKRTLKKFGQFVEDVPKPLHVYAETIDPALSESTRLDLDDLGALRSEVSAVFASGFGTAEMAEIVAVAERMKLNKKEVFSFPVQYSRSFKTLYLTLLLDDLESLCIGFRSDEQLIEALRSALEKCEG